MNFSRQFLLGLLALGLYAGFAAAIDPAPVDQLSESARLLATQLFAAAIAPAPVNQLPNAPPATIAAAAPAVAAPAPAAPQVPSLAGACCDNSSCAPSHGQFLSGVGLYLIEPYFENNLAFGLQKTVGGSPGSSSDNRVDIVQHMDIAPLVWLGYISEDGLGGRGRYWYFRQGTSQTEPPGSSGSTSVVINSAAPLGLSLTTGGGMTVTSKLELQVADLEGLEEFRACNWDFLFSFGVRLADIEQTYNAYTPQSTDGTLLSSHAFHGVGPTLALEARRPLGLGGLSFYTSARGSLLLGSAHQDAVVPNADMEGDTFFASDHRDRGVPIAELEVGLEYGRDLGQSRVFGQIALVGQDWFGAGSASRSQLNVIPGGAFMGSYVGDSDIAFLGVSFRLGVNY